MFKITKEEFLTVRWNNILSVGIGIPSLMYIIYAYSTSLWTSKVGLIVLAVIGVIY
jgi:hypothetical protein